MDAIPGTLQVPCDPEVKKVERMAEMLIQDTNIVITFSNLNLLTSSRIFVE